MKLQFQKIGLFTEFIDGGNDPEFRRAIGPVDGSYQGQRCAGIEFHALWLIPVAKGIEQIC